MVDNDHRLDRTFAALGHAARRAILARLRHGPATICALATPFDMSLNAVSKHVKVLEHAGLVRRHIRGREHYCALDARPLRRPRAWIDDYRDFWEQQIDALDEFLRKKQRTAVRR